MKEEPLVELGRWLRASSYAFTTVTPETHRRANANAAAAGRRAATLRDVLGWNRPFDPRVVPERVLDLLRAADAVDEGADGLIARVRFSTLQEHLFAHGGYPTDAPDAVFFGPDTYRFCDAIAATMPEALRVVDVGCGSGAGGICAGRLAKRVVLSDVNDGALAMARVNAALNGREVEVVKSDVLASVGRPFDCVVANPPYLVDSAARTYRDGGGALGASLSLRIARESLAKLARGGTLILYTGAAVANGVDTFEQSVTTIAREAGATFRYREVDPDVFGEELETPAYAAVDRIAAVLFVATLPKA